MKRLGSLLLSFLMLVCMLPISAAATTPAETDAEKLIFDMDLSTYATDGKILNSVAGNDSTFTYSTNKPSPKTVDKTGTPYITFRETDDSNKSNAFKIEDAGFASQNELTVETWVRPDGWDSASVNSIMFALYANSSNVMDVAKWGTATVWDYYIAGDAKHSSNIRPGISALSPYDETWTHLVFTRKWTPDAEGAATGTWTGTLYINGDSYTQTKTTGSVTRTEEGSTATMFVGSRWLDNGNDFKGSMGDFKVYQSILSAEQAKAKYEATKGDYYYEAGEREMDENKLFFDMSIADDGTVTNAAFDDGGTEISTQNVTMGETVTGQNYFSFRESGAVDSASSVKVTDSYFVNQNELTLEMWVRPQDWQSTKSTTIANDDERLFSLRGTRSYMDYYFYKTATHRYQPFVDSATKSVSLSGMAAYDEKWTHLVFTRKWTPDSEGAATGTWTANMYVNGIQKVTDWTYTDTRVEEDATTAFIIGNASHGGPDSFSGDIAMVKAYQSILDADTIGANYMSSYTTYYPEMPADDAEKLVFDMDISRYSAANTVTNAAPYGDSLITVNSAPALGELANGTKYLTFDSKNEDGTYNNNTAGIKVADDNFTESEEMTFEMWMRPTNFVTGAQKAGSYIFTALGGKILLRQYDYTSDNKLWWEPFGDNKVKRHTIYVTGTDAAGSYSYNNRFSHYVFTRKWNAETAEWESKVYINGKENAASGTATSEPASGSGNALYIGSSASFGQSFEGDFATFKVYNSVLAADAVAAKYTAERGNYAELGEDKLIFDMDLSEYTAENPVVTSASGNANISVQGTLAVGATANGKKYLTFDSKNEDGTYANNTSGLKVVDDTLMNQKAMTVETWVRGTNFGPKSSDRDANFLFEGPRMRVNVYDSSSNSALWWQPAGDNASFRIQKTDMGAMNDQWKHLVFTKSYDATAGNWKGTLYIDGSKWTDKTYTSDFGTETSNVLMIGNNKELAKGFEGDIATFKVYNTALTDAQVKANYKADKEGMQGLIAMEDFTTEDTEITATVDADLLAQNPYVVIALYNDADALVQVASGTTLTIGENVTLAEGYYARCFVWGSKTDLKPLTKDAVAYCL